MMSVLMVLLSWRSHSVHLMNKPQLGLPVTYK